MVLIQQQRRSTRTRKKRTQFDGKQEGHEQRFTITPRPEPGADTPPSSKPNNKTHLTARRQRDGIPHNVAADRTHEAIGNVPELLRRLRQLHRRFLRAASATPKTRAVRIPTPSLPATFIRPHTTWSIPVCHRLKHTGGSEKRVPLKKKIDPIVTASKKYKASKER